MSIALGSRSSGRRVASCAVWMGGATTSTPERSEEHTSELQSLRHLVCRLLLEKKKKKKHTAQQGLRARIRRTREARHRNTRECASRTLHARDSDRHASTATPPRQSTSPVPSNK